MTQAVAPGGQFPAMEPGHELEKLENPHALVQPKVTRDESQVAVDAFGPGPAVAPEDPGGAAVRPQQSQQDTDGGRLSRSVRTEESEDLSDADLEG